MKIEYVNFGIGYRLGNKILINKVLKKYPELHDYVLQHELGHTEGMSIKDIKHDLSFKNQLKILGLSIRHPSFLWSSSPIIIYNKKIHINLSAIIFWIIGITIGLLLVYGASYYISWIESQPIKAWP